MSNEIPTPSIVRNRKGNQTNATPAPIEKEPIHLPIAGDDSLPADNEPKNPPTDDETDQSSDDEPTNEPSAESLDPEFVTSLLGLIDVPAYEPPSELKATADKLAKAMAVIEPLKLIDENMYNAALANLLKTVQTSDTNELHTWAMANPSLHLKGMRISRLLQIVDLLSTAYSKETDGKIHATASGLSLRKRAARTPNADGKRTKTDSKDLRPENALELIRKHYSTLEGFGPSRAGLKFNYNGSDHYALLHENAAGDTVVIPAVFSQGSGALNPVDMTTSYPTLNKWMNAVARPPHDLPTWNYVRIPHPEYKVAGYRWLEKIDMNEYLNTKVFI